MSASPARRSRVLFVCVLALGLGACSARKIAYRMAPTLLVSAANDMLDLTSAQKDWLRPELRSLFAWHRREELRGWATALDELRRRLGDGLQPDDVQWTRTTTGSLFFRVARKAAPLGGELFARVTPAQIDHAKQEMQRERGKRTGEDKSPERALEKQVKERIKSLERWTGPLTDTQRGLINEHLRHTSSDLLLRRTIENVTTNLEVDANGEWWNRHFPYPQVKSTSLSWNGRHRERITVDLNPPIPDVEEWLEDPDDG